MTHRLDVPFDNDLYHELVSLADTHTGGDVAEMVVELVESYVYPDRFAARKWKEENVDSSKKIR